jgi:hypothetical protein
VKRIDARHKFVTKSELMTHEEALCFNDPRAVFQTNGHFQIQTRRL